MDFQETHYEQINESSWSFHHGKGVQTLLQFSLRLVPKHASRELMQCITGDSLEGQTK